MEKSKNDDDNIASSSIDQGGKHEDEASNKSYLDRVRLFETKFCSKGSSNSFLGRRNTRFCTQPVTPEEIEEAKSRNRRPLKVEDSEETFKTECLDKNKTLKLEDSKEKCKSTTSWTDPPPSFIKSQNNVISELNNILKNSSLVQKNCSSHSPNQSTIKENISLNDEEKVFKSIQSQKVSTKQEKEIKIKNWFLPKESQSRQKNESNSRNNSSSVVKSQSHSGVLSVFETSEKSSNDLADSSNGVKGRELNKISERPDSCDDVQMKLEGCLRRSLTQPFRPSVNVEEDDLNGATIRERLDRLIKNGDLGWQNRKCHAAKAKDELLVVSPEDHIFKSRNVMEEPKNEQVSKIEESKFTSLADRLNKLGAAQSGWKKRIQQSDATRFSVEGKMISENASNLSFPPTKITRQRRSPKAVKFRSKEEGGVSSNPDPSATETDLATSTSKDDVNVPSGFFSSNDSKMSQETIAIIPQNDDETFTSFFNGFSEKPTNYEKIEINDEDLDAVARMKSSQLLFLKKNIKTQKRKKIIQNPLKSLALRLESQMYTERRTQKSQTEFKKLRSAENASFSNENVSNMAIEALAGLASREDFTAINLKKASDDVVSPDAPYKDPMLMQVKGRRHVQTRLVEPVAASINAGDCFILVTGNKIFNYVGKFANVIEKCRSSEISCHIQQKGDLGCSADSVITVGESGKATQEQTEEFWKVLGGSPGCEREAGNPDEDEIFESCLADTNMVYELIDDELVPVETVWGSAPKFEILDPFKVFVFDFGSEFYVWNGKNVSLPKRRIAIKLGKELWEEGFNYLDCALCPVTAASFAGLRNFSEEIPDSAKMGSSRPSWALFAKITQNMETVLFREKFLDWPNHARVVGKHKREERVGDKKNVENGEIDGHVFTDLILPDPVTMTENVVPLPDLVLEGSHLGRGLRYRNEETGISTEITTKNVTTWHINEFEYSRVPCDSEGQFHMGDSYVVRWHYVVNVIGRNLKGLPSKHLTAGRDRYAYFCWQGQNSLISDKGAAACLTIELDKENGPQVRVTQGLEPPAFLNLFQGKMVVHRGKRSSEVPCDKWRLFLSRGESETESVLFEVPCSAEHLRSAGSYVIVNAAKGKMVVWHGSKSGERQKKVAVAAAERIKNQRPKEFQFSPSDVSVSTEIEGEESKDFLNIFENFDRKLYYSLVDKNEFQMTTPRLFYLSSFSGQLQFSEVSSPYLGEKTTTPFPFLQSDLYSAFQPALFLFDAGSILWLWQGWQEEGSKSDRGSENLRFQAERRAAMTTALSYWTQKCGNTSTPNVYLIWAGLEPLIFTNQFPFWTIRDDVSRLNMKDGRKPGEMIDAKDELDNLSHSFYPPLQLQSRPLPEGVNPFSLEDYLKPQYFQELFGLEKEEFFKMPSWKKKKLKKEAGLF